MGFNTGYAGFDVRHRELTSIDNADATVHQAYLLNEWKIEIYPDGTGLRVTKLMESLPVS
jgi:hypothetical protein